MRKFNIGETQTRKKGVAKTNAAANLPGFQALSSKVSIGTIDVTPIRQYPYVASPFDYALERTQLAQSLQCKEIRDLTIPEAKLYGIRNNHHCNQRPHFGNMRGDPKGLAYDPVYPVNNPLLIRSDKYFAYLKTPLKKHSSQK